MERNLCTDSMSKMVNIVKFYDVDWINVLVLVGYFTLCIEINCS